MTFLQPFVLFGLPLVLLPVIIHLINRRRYRSQPWAAMQFLRMATRHSTSHARLRNFLILLFRVLTILALVFFLSRPLAGGWMGWAVSAAPDVIIILLDRSASMETQLDTGEQTKREKALELLAQAAGKYESSSHLVLLDSASMKPQELADLEDLNTLPNTQPTDTAADIPALIQIALTWLVDNQAGTAELWIASDLQSANWHREDSRWASIKARLQSFPQTVRVKLLAFSESGKPNASLTLNDLFRQEANGADQLNLVLDLHRKKVDAEVLPVKVMLNDNPSTRELNVEGQSIRWRPKLPLPAESQGGWGKLELPADANARDNTVWFVYGGDVELRSGLVALDHLSARFLGLAAYAHALGKGIDAVDSAPSLSNIELADKSLLIWQAPLPAGSDAERLEAFLNEGGIVIFFPSNEPDGASFKGVGWGPIESATEERSFQIQYWDEQQGPLAKTEEGLSLPLSEVRFQKRREIVGQVNVLAAFTDGQPFLARERWGRGDFYFCASLPNPEWSSLNEGPVLVPMIQRLTQFGSRRLQPRASYACGELNPDLTASVWTSVTGASSDRVHLRAGIYQSGDRLIAMNRPVGEDEPEILSQEETAGLFEGASFQMLTDRRGSSDPLQGEVWRMLLVGMLVFLLVESGLVLPSGGFAAPGSRSKAKENAHG